MTFLSSFTNAVLIDNCANLHNLTVRLDVTEDFITVANSGFDMQLNCYPPDGQWIQKAGIIAAGNSNPHPR